MLYAVIAISLFMIVIIILFPIAKIKKKKIENR